MVLLGKDVMGRFWRGAGAGSGKKRRTDFSPGDSGSRLDSRVDANLSTS